MLWASLSSLESNFRLSLSSGGEAASLPLGTGCGSSSKKNKRETTSQRKTRSQEKVWGANAQPLFLPGELFFGAYFQTLQNILFQSRGSFPEWCW